MKLKIDQLIQLISVLNRKVLLLGFFIVTALYFTGRALTDPEPHHDGLIFANAVASKDGLFPNRDFFSQYGPLFATIGGSLLKIFGSHLYVLRIYNAIILAVISLFILYWISKFFGIRFAIPIALIWVLSSGQIWVALLPWSSVLLQLIIISSASLLVSYSRKDGLKANFAFFFSGLILTLGIFVRIQTSLFVILLGAILISERKRLVKKLNSFICGSLFSLLISLTWLALNHSLVDFYAECIVWAQEKYGSPSFPILSLIPLLYFPAITIAWSLWYRYLELNSRAARKKVTVLKLIPFLFLPICLLVTLLNDQSYLSISHPDIFIRDILANFLFSQHYIVVTSAFSIFILFLYQVVKVPSQILTSNLTEKLALFLLLTGLIQLYPAWDKGHIWYVTPQILFGIALYFSDKKRIFQSLKLHMVPSVMSFLLILVLQNAIVMSQSRIQHQDGIFKFMWSPPRTVSNFEVNFAALRTVPTESSILFDCTDAIFSVSEGSYSSRNLNMVNWAPRGLSKTRDAEYVFACNMTTKDIAIYLDRDFFLLATYPSINLADKNNYLLKRNKLSELE